LRGVAAALDRAAFLFDLGSRVSYDSVHVALGHANRTGPPLGCRKPDPIDVPVERDPGHRRNSSRRYGLQKRTGPILLDPIAANRQVNFGNTGRTGAPSPPGQLRKFLHGPSSEFVLPRNYTSAGLARVHRDRTAYAAAVSVEMEPEGVFLHLLGKSQTSSLWHLSDAERALTLCGLDVGYGNPRMTWASTPIGQRCEVCLDRFRGEL